MGKRLTSGVAMLAVGAALLVASAFAGQSGNGGVFKLAVVGPGDTVDPQVAYNTLSWSFEHATAANLVNFPDKRGAAGARLIPEVARSYSISKDGRRYTFVIRRGFRFSDGSRVSARNFAYAFRRVLSPKLQSPGSSFITDPNGAYVRSYKAVGNRFVVKLAKPFGPFLSLMTMPFFQATSTSLPLHRQAVAPIPSAGPYTTTFDNPNTRSEIRRNRYYGGARQHHLAGLNAYYNQNVNQAYLDTLKNKFDEGPVPPDGLGCREVTPCGRFVVKSAPCIGWIPYNLRSGLLHRNPAMRKALNWALDRRNYAAADGPYAARPWTHILPPHFPGSVMKKRLQPYANTSRYAKARKLAAGHFRDGKIILVVRLSGITGPKQKDLITRDLVNIGFKRENISYTIPPELGGMPPKWDIWVSIGWCQDYSDPLTFFKLFLAPSNDNPLYIPSAKWRKRIKAADELTGEARLSAFGKLDLALMTKYAPVAPMRTYNNVFLFSSRVVRRSLVYSGVYSDFDLTRIRLK
jgi:ABC-type oligopeptide transport system substrate-binding subunit